MEKKAFPKAYWHRLARDGCVGIEARVCLIDRRSVTAMLRLGKNSRTDIHPAPYDIHVLCIDGSGFATSAGEVVEQHSGESVLWPKNEDHNIYTESSEMTAIMLEHVHQLQK